MRFWTLDLIKKIHSAEKEITEEVDPETGELCEEEKWVYRDKKNGAIQPIDLYARGLKSRIFQHEIDHLDGRVIWDEDQFKILDTQATEQLGDAKFYEEFMQKNGSKMLVY